MEQGERERMYDRMRDLAGNAYILYLLLCSTGYEGGFEAVEEFLVEGGFKVNPVKVLLEQAESLELDIERVREQLAGGAAGLIPIRFGEGERALATLSKELRGNLTEADRLGRRLDRAGLMLAGADLLAQELFAVFDATDEAAINAIRSGFANVAAGIAEIE